MIDKDLVPRIRIGKRDTENIRLLIAHALTDIEYGGGGTYSIDPSGAQKPDERQIKRAMEAIRFIALLLENKI